MIRAVDGTEFVKTESGEIVGINLGYDFCAEHEMGIAFLVEAFGLDREKNYGYEGRKNTIVPRQLVHHEASSALIFRPYDCSEKILEYLLEHELSLRGEELAGAWSSADFGVRTVPKHGPLVKELYEVFTRKNGIITLSPRENPFANPGLILLNYEKIPEVWKTEAREKDKKYREEQAMFRKLEQESDVFDLLKSRGLDFLYLKIERLDKKGQPLWWLNPCNQRSNKAGWYSTEDLRKWADGKGPVVERMKE